MAENLSELTIGGNALRLEHLKLPNGNTYILGVSLEELQSVYNTLSGNIDLVNTDVEDLKDTVEENELIIASSLVDLKEENEALRQEIAELRDLIERRYMAYYDVDATSGIVADNVYTTT